MPQDKSQGQISCRRLIFLPFLKVIHEIHYMYLCLTIVVLYLLRNSELMAHPAKLTQVSEAWYNALVMALALFYCFQHGLGLYPCIVCDQ